MVNMLNHNILIPDWKETMEYLENVFDQGTLFRTMRDISAFILPDIGFRFPVGPQLKKNKIETPDHHYHWCQKTPQNGVGGRKPQRSEITLSSVKEYTKRF